MTNPYRRLDGRHSSVRPLLVERLEFRQLLAADILSDVTLGVWERLDRLPPAHPGAVSYLNAAHFTSWSIDRATLSESLAEVPLEFTDAAFTQSSILALPTPDGDFARFQIVESPIMEPALAAQFPEIKTYRGQGIDDGAATLRFDVSPYGFRAQVLAPSGAYYIDPYWHQSDLAYISYFKRDLVPRPDQLQFEFRTDDPRSEPLEKQSEPDGPKQSKEDDVARLDTSGGKSGDSSTAGRSGTQLRTYRLANAATGEYTQFHGGTVAAAQAAIVTSINRVTGIYEKEVAVRLVLVGNNSSLVYTNGGTDPYSNNDGGAMLSQNQTNVDSLIGNANYDIGHVFSTGGGGVAGLGVVGVAGQKARGVTGSGAPIGDPFDVDYVAHEMGHQFAGNHTFNGTNGSCGGNRRSTAAYEPGSGSSIMGYAGICGADNLQNNSDPYFHSFSFDEIVQYTTTGSGNSAAVVTNTGNSVPRVYAGKDYVIPSSTPFTLDAFGIDADSGDVLSFHWEQRDLGAAQALSAADNGSSPLFRSWNPSADTSRTLPRLPELLNNTTPIGERLPTTNRSLNFRAIVRDNFGGGGGVNTDDMRITVANTGAAFAVTSPNTAVSYPANSQQTVTWNVASTSSAPINESEVDVWLSTDGGLTFPILLVQATPNDGSQIVTLPNLSSTTARVKVAARNSIFFDVSNTNFTITGSTNTAPTITGISNVWIPWNTSTATIPFVIGDAQTAASQLTVAAFSSNATLVPSSRIEIGGSGANRSIRIRPALGEFGETRIFVGVTDSSGATSYETFLFYAEASSSCESFETFDGVAAPTLPAGWISTSNVGTSRWETSATSSHSGVNNAFIPNSGAITDTFLVSPIYTAPSGNSEIRFQNSYNFESGFDGGVLEISIDGAAFADFIVAGGSFTTGGYTSTLSTQYQNPLGGRQAWSGNSGGYRSTVASLPASSQGKNVQFRWRLGTDSSVSAPGWRVDTLQRCGVIVPPILSIDTASSTSDEGNSGTINMPFTLTRRGKTNVETTVEYSVSGFGDDPASADDFEGGFPSGTVTFPVNATSVTLSIPIRGDILREKDESFRIVLSNASGDALLDVIDAIGTIRNDDDVEVVQRGVYYRGSSFQSSGGVDGAIDTSKTLAQASSSSQVMGFQNLINTTRGINGLVFDIAGIIGAGLSASDFAFRMSPTGVFSNSANPPSSWANAPAPTALAVTPGSGSSPARVRIDWADNAIANRWLQIKILANNNTGLLNSQVYYLGHLYGEINGAVSSEQFQVTISDVTSLRPNVGFTAPVTSRFDLDKNGSVSIGDVTGMRPRVGLSQLRVITIPPSGSSEEGEGDFGARQTPSWEFSAPAIFVMQPPVAMRGSTVQPRWIHEVHTVEQASNPLSEPPVLMKGLESWLRSIPSSDQRKSVDFSGVDSFFEDILRENDLDRVLL
jgi:hypothetical protein